MTNDSKYSIVFHTDEDFTRALDMIQALLPDDTDAQGIEMFWTKEWWRNRAVRELKRVGITVDTFTL